MFDEKLFDEFESYEAEDEVKKAWGNSKKRSFPYGKLSLLPDGSTILRFMPPTPGKERCPKGFVYVSNHRVYFDLGEEKHPRIVCTQRSDSPCYVHDVLRVMARHKKEIPAAVTEAIAMMDSDSFRCMAYPITLFAAPADESDSKSKYVKSDVESGMLLQVYAKQMNRRIRELFQMYPDLNSEDTGRYLLLKKKGWQYELGIAPNAKPCPVKNQDLLSEYSTEIDVYKAFYKDVKEFSYDEQRDYLSKAWFMQDPTVQKILSAYDLLESKVTVPPSTSNSKEDFSFDDDIPF